MKRRDFLKLSAGAAAMWPLVGFCGERQEHAKLDGITLYDTQQQFVDCKARIKAMIGGRASGLTFAGGFNLRHHARNRGLYWAIGVDRNALRYMIVPSLKRVDGHPTKWQHLNSYFMTGRIRTRDGGHAHVVCMTANDAMSILEQFAENRNLRTLFVDGVWIDDASRINIKHFGAAIIMLHRYQSKDGWIALTLSPSSTSHWTYGVCQDCQRLDSSVFRAKTTDNPYLPEEFARLIGDRYRKESESLYRKEILGRFA